MGEGPLGLRSKDQPKTQLHHSSPPRSPQRHHSRTPCRKPWPSSRCTLWTTPGTKTLGAEGAPELDGTSSNASSPRNPCCQATPCFQCGNGDDDPRLSPSNGKLCFSIWVCFRRVTRVFLVRRAWQERPVEWPWKMESVSSFMRCDVLLLPEDF